jgi:hypothetical protein
MNSNELLFFSLKKYYTISDNILIIKNIIDGHLNSKLSLRLIDWYVTNYCKNNNVVYSINKNEYFNVYMNYRAQLKAFKKIQFDPFRRRERIVFKFNETDYINTTIGQLNFFRWAIENKVIENLQNNIVCVEKDMINRQKFHKIKLDNTGQQMENKKNSIKNMTKFTGNTTITFN